MKGANGWSEGASNGYWLTGYAGTKALREVRLYDVNIRQRPDLKISSFFTRPIASVLTWW
jgi:hypothetical protein